MVVVVVVVVQKEEEDVMVGTFAVHEKVLSTVRAQQMQQKTHPLPHQCPQPTKHELSHVTPPTSHITHHTLHQQHHHNTLQRSLRDRLPAVCPARFVQQKKSEWRLPLGPCCPYSPFYFRKMARKFCAVDRMTGGKESASCCKFSCCGLQSRGRRM